MMTVRINVKMFQAMVVVGQSSAPRPNHVADIKGRMNQSSTGNQEAIEKFNLCFFVLAGLKFGMFRADN